MAVVTATVLTTVPPEKQFATLLEIKNGANSFVRTAIDNSGHLAMGYVLGRQDADGIKNTDGAWRFAIAYELTMAEYKTGLRGSMPSVMDAYRAFFNL